MQALALTLYENAKFSSVAALTFSHKIKSWQRLPSVKNNQNKNLFFSVFRSFFQKSTRKMNKIFSKDWRK
jgi:hypothetical protein